MNPPAAFDRRRYSHYFEIEIVVAADDAPSIVSTRLRSPGETCGMTKFTW